MLYTIDSTDQTIILNNIIDIPSENFELEFNNLSDTIITEEAVPYRTLSFHNFEGISRNSVQQKVRTDITVQVHHIF